MKLFGSLLFRLTLLHTLVFSVFLALLITAYFVVNVHRPIGVVKKQIQSELAAIERQHGAKPAADLVRALTRRTVIDAGRKPFHVLVGPDEKTLIGNLPRWPAYRADGWLLLESARYYTGEENYHVALMADKRLKDGSRLLIGRDIEDLQQRRAAIFGAARWLLVGGTIFGLLSGAVMSRSIGRRLDSINTTARRVMAGDLSGRIPTYGRRDDFAQLGDTLNLMLSRIQDLLTSLRRVSDSVAHELRTPLTRLHTDLSELKEAPSLMGSHLMDQAIIETENVISLFDAVIRIGRIENSRDGFTLAPVSLSDILADAVEIFTPSAENKKIEFSVSIEDNIWIDGDRNILFQAIGNILDNAIKYTPAGGVVKVIAISRLDEVDVYVVDNGYGIPEDKYDIVFERFVRLPETHRAPGLGLGLSFVKAVADVHASKLWLEDAAPGLRFRWTFYNARHASR